ncbi:hypothetical protein BDV28DRAFT_150836 [Aspergillus coremiiformis]|uniref:Uncharacterized protein n=1 Tax=Aspergillus coremiiformis TaxID=138285 RepID=A0A5N6YYU5_9EURO|nr:hypothetical protein BDV28DRAFT_150836 [Aspergillus coremiiformis]
MKLLLLSPITAVLAALPKGFTLVDDSNTVLTNGSKHPKPQTPNPNTNTTNPPSTSHRRDLRFPQRRDPKAYVPSGSLTPQLTDQVRRGPNSTITYTHDDSAPLVKYLFAVDGDVRPLGLAVPGAVPDGADVTGFGVTDGFLTFRGKMAFGRSAVDKLVYFLGRESDIPVQRVWVKELRYY